MTPLPTHRDALLTLLRDRANSAVDDVAHDEFPEHLNPLLRGPFGFEIDRMFAEPFHALMLSGRVIDRGDAVGHLTVRYHPEAGLLDLSGLKVDPVSRGHGVAATFGLHALYAARALGYSRITLLAGPTMGRALWARYGFSFGRTKCQTDVRRWFSDALKLLGESDELIEGCNSPRDFYLVGAGELLDVGLQEFAERVGYEDLDFADIVDLNEGAADLTLGHALMLFGPDWHGSLRVDTPAAASLEAMCKRRLQAIGAQVPAPIGR